MSCGDYRYSRPAVDFIESIVSKLRSSGTIISTTDNGDGTFECEVSGLLGLTAGYYVTIAGTDYQVISVDTNVPSFTIEIAAAPSGVFTRPEPYFFHGSPIDIQRQISERTDHRAKFPAIWLFEPFAEEQNIDPRMQVGTTADIKLIFVHEANPQDWTHADHHNTAIAPMRTYAEDFIRYIRTDSRVVRDMFTVYRNEEKVSFGVYITDQGHTSLIIAEQVSGLYLEFSLPLTKKFCNCNGSSGAGTSPSCAPAIVNRDGEFYSTVASGATINVISAGGSCADATWTLVNTNNDNLDSGSIASGGSDEITAPDATAVLKNTQGTTLSSTDIPSGDSGNITAPDATVTVNDVEFTTFQSGATSDILLTDENDSPIEVFGVNLPSQIRVGNTQLQVNGVNVDNVTPGSNTPYNLLVQNTDGENIGTPGNPTVIDDSVVTVNGTFYTSAFPESTTNVDVEYPDGTDTGSLSGGKWKVPNNRYNVASIAVTGQSTSYAANDDGATKRGRLVNWTTLSKANPFGNTNRFTDTLGTQLYANNLVLDWGYADYLSKTVPMWDRQIRGAAGAVGGAAVSWATMLGLLPFTANGYNDWSVANEAEWRTILKGEGTPRANYAPFNFNTNMWSITTNPGDSTVALRYIASGFALNDGLGIVNGPKTNTMNFALFRYATFAELGITNW